MELVVIILAGIMCFLLAIWIILSLINFIKEEIEDLFY